MSHGDLPDRTGTVPFRRMSVVRGTLRIPSPVEVPEAALALARSAAVLAAKEAPSLVAGLHPASLTHVEASFDVQEGSVECTVTVQGFVRDGLDSAALFALAAALTSLRHGVAVPEASLEGLHLVQNVPA